MSPAMTDMSVILGTAAYMSPEQARGTRADQRTDIWSFGAVLLEMLTGKPVFNRETLSHVLASVLRTEPDWTALPPNTPPSIRRLLRRCIDKDRRRRLDSAAAAGLELDDARTAPPEEVQPAQAPRRVAALTIASVLGGVLVAVLALWAFHAARAARGGTADALHDHAASGASTEIVATKGRRDFAVAPDGSFLVVPRGQSGPAGRALARSA